MNVTTSREPFSLERPRPRRPGDVVSVASLAGLGAIHGHATSMAIHRRELEGTDFARESAWVHRLPRFDAVVSRASDLPPLRGAPASASGDWFRADVTALFTRFLELAGTDRARVAMGSVGDDSCRYFHVDHVALRLVTTYVGPGTEWVSPGDVDVGQVDRFLQQVHRSPPIEGTGLRRYVVALSWPPRLG